MIIRIKSNKGQSRVTIEKSDTTSILYEKTAAVLGISASDFQLGINGSLVKQNAATLEQSGIKHGDILELKYLQNDTPSSTPKPNLVKGAIAPVPIKDHPVDALLEKEDGKIYRTKDSHFCKHGATGMCDYCMPLEPYDSTYLTENKIKHMSYHSYLRQITSSNKSALPTSSHFIPPLDNFTFTVKVPCSSGTHDPYPAGICTKCQPSAATLQSQNFRMVDHLEFESASLIENFLQFWRKTGIQRFGYLYGRYEPYAQVPLGVKAVVCAIYEPKQQGATDSIQVELTPEPMEKEMKEFEELMGLEKIGMIYTDLTHDSTGAGTVVCKRHADSYFLSSAECMFSGLMQLKYPTVTKYSCDGVFGSRFITCVISGNENNEIDISSFQVSNMGMCMVKDDIIEASMDPSLIRVKKSTPTHYIPEVFYKYKNEYGRLVQEAAAPTFPVDYLLVTQTHGFPQTPTPTFTSPTAFPIENRDGLLNRQELSDVKKHLSSVLSLGNQDDLFKLLDDFHILFYFMTGGIIEKNDFKVLVDAIKTKNFRTFQKFVSSASWQTMLTLLNEIASFSSSIQGPVSANKPSGGVWVCRHCTFRNSDTEMCEMCGLPNE